MDITQVKREVESWAQEAQNDLAHHLAVLRGKRDPDHIQELRRRLRDSTQAHWFTADEFRAKLGSEMHEYALFVRREFYDESANLSEPERAEVLRFIESLRIDPFQEPDHKQVDARNVPYLSRVLGRVALYYWVDHAMCELRILDMVHTIAET